MKLSKEIIRGSLRIAILDALSQSDEYGYSLAQIIRTRSNNLLKAGEGSLYPALYKLEGEKCISSYWDRKFTPARKYYSITSSGKKELEEQKGEWNRFVGMMDTYLKFQEQPG